MTKELKNLVESWKNFPNLDESLKKQLLKMTPDEIIGSFSTRLDFGTAGMRGLMGPGLGKLNIYTCRAAAYAIGQHLEAKFPDDLTIPVIIGHDTRLNSERFALEIAHVLSSFERIEIKIYINNDPQPTPLISYTVRKLGAKAGINITASHNPKQFNGIKVYDETGSQILPPEAQSIKKYFAEIDDVLNIKYTVNKKRLSYIPISVEAEYIKKISEVTLQPNLNHNNTNVVVTTHHGAASKILPKVLKNLKYRIIPVEEQMIYDADFKNSAHLNPEDERSFELAIKYADKNKVDTIIALDPDGDRMGIAIRHEQKWHYMTGNQMGIIYFHYITKFAKDLQNCYVVASHNSNNLIDRIAKKHNIEVVRVPTGFKWVGGAINQDAGKRRFLLGFEEAIGALLSDAHRDKDGIQASIFALEIITHYAAKQMDLVDVLEKEIFPEYGYWYGYTNHNTIEGYDWQKIAQKWMSNVLKPDAELIKGRKIHGSEWLKHADSVEWDLGEGSWIKFRSSGTEPKFKVYYNLYGTDSDSLKKEKATIDELLKRYLK